MKPADRPDGLILFDDYLTMGLTDRLGEQPTYRPEITTTANRQAPLLYSLPVMRFELDIEAIARTAVDMVMRRLLDPDTPLHVATYRPQMRMEAP